MHHLVCLACLAVSLFTRHGHVYIETMVITEVTTPLINIRWFLDKAGACWGERAGGAARVAAAAGGARPCWLHLAATQSLPSAARASAVPPLDASLNRAHTKPPPLCVCARAGMKRSLAYRVNGLSIVAFWFLGRICIFIPYGVHILSHFDESLLMAPPALLLALICPGLLATLNVMWFKQILRGAVKMMRRQDDDEDEGRSPKAAKKKGQ